MTNTGGGSTPPKLEELLEQARHRVEVEDKELAEARRRRDMIAAALRSEFPGSKVYVNGSVAHGDALTPLTDVDVGVIVAEAQQTHGPGKRGPLDLMDRAADAIREALKEDFPKLSVTVKGQTRAVLVRFRDPVTPGQDDFTADVIVALENAVAAGLWIPHVPTWDRSHPVGHTDMVRTANQNSRYSYAKVVRLLKHWNRRNGKPMCSWNIKALALDCVDTPHTMMAGLRTWFEHAHADLSTRGETPDPARVAPEPIHLNEAKRVVLGRLEKAAEQLRRAAELEKAGYPALAHQQLAQLFNDPEMLPGPDPVSLMVEESRRRVSAAGAAVAAPALVAAPAAPKVRSWAP
jgi:predicted nucleotidyltransferase